MAPGAHASVLAGSPLTLPARAALAGAFCLAGFLWMFRPARTPRWWAVAAVAALTVIKVVIGVASVPAGWRGTYEVLPPPTAVTAAFPHRFRIQPFRVDPRIDFEGRNFALHFLNSMTLERLQVRRDHRGGFEIGNRQRDTDEPFRVTWDGYFDLPGETHVEIGARSSGKLTVLVDGRHVISSSDGAAPAASLMLASGSHSVKVYYQKPAGTVPLVRLTLANGTTREPLHITPWPADAGRADASRSLARATTVLVLAGLAGGFLAFVLIYIGEPSGPRHGGSLIGATACYGSFLVLALLAFLLSLPLYGTTEGLWEGGDPLAYESNARDVLQNGLLMPQPVEGPRRPYYFYPLYAYALAGAHLLVGDDIGAAVMLNGWSLACLPILFWWAGWAALPSLGAVAALGVLTLFIGWDYMRYATAVFTDCLYVAVAFLAVVLAIRAVKSGLARQALLAGVVSALAAATRPSFMTFVPVLVAALVFFDRQRDLRSRARLGSWAVVGMAAGLTPFATRNYIVSGQFVPLVNSWIQLPYFLTPPGVPNPIDSLEWVVPPTLGESIRMAWDIFRASPLHTVLVELRKVAMTLGFTNFGRPGMPWHLELPPLVVVAALAVWWRAVPWPLLLVGGSFAVSHMAAMILAAPWTGGYKNILPFHVVMLLAAGFLVSKMRWLAGGTGGTNEGREVPTSVSTT